LALWYAGLNICLLSAFCHPDQASAQVLNQRVNQLLANNCAGLGTGGFIPNPAVLAQFGPNLRTLCQSPETTGANSIGGGAGASFQGAAASILNRVLVQRLDDLREEDRNVAKDRPTAMTVNPLGALLAGFGQTSSLSSPLSQAGSAGGSSGGAINLGTPSRWHGLGLFASGLVESLNRDITTFQDGFKSTILGLTAGADYRFARNLVMGFAGNYSNTNGDFRSGGTFSTNSYGGLLFGSYFPTDRTFLQVTGGYTKNNHLISRLTSANISEVGVGPLRTITGLASSNSTADVFNASILTGYDHPIGRFTIGPRLGLTYGRTKIGGYTEDGGTGIELGYDDQYVTSLQSVVGIQASAAVSMGWGILVPQFNADYIHEFENNQRFINVQFAEDLRATPTRFTFQNDVPVRNYGNLGIGLLAVLPNGIQPFVSFRAMVGNSQFDNYAGTFGVRIEL
jgi:uncharacterized protein YhjY with autotransporter beta-barrel domain